MVVNWNPIVDWDNEGWREQAACRYTDANLFFRASHRRRCRPDRGGEDGLRVLPGRERVPSVRAGHKPGIRYLGRQ